MSPLTPHEVPPTYAPRFQVEEFTPRSSELSPTAYVLDQIRSRANVIGKAAIAFALTWGASTSTPFGAYVTAPTYMYATYVYSPRRRLSRREMRARVLAILERAEYERRAYAEAEARRETALSFER